MTKGHGMTSEELADEERQRHLKMTETPMPRLILSLAVPTVISMTVSTVYNTADTWFVSRLGTSASGAVSVVFSLMAIFQAFGFMFGQGAGSSISVNLGSGHPERAKRYASTSFFSSLLVSAVISVIGLCLQDPLLRLLGCTETILPYARQYTFWILVAGPLLATSCVLNNILRYEGHASYAMAGLMTGALLNMAGDPIFMFVLGLGVSGAGLSTAVSQLISFTILLFMYRRKDVVSEFRLRYALEEPQLILDIIRVGFPSLIRQGLGSVSTICLNRMGAAYGDAAIAAMGIVSKVNGFSASVTIGIGQGYQPVASYNYGAKRYDRVRKGFRFTSCTGMGIMLVFGTFFLLFSETIITWFRDDPDVIAIGSVALRFQALAGVMMGYSMACSMLFQSTRNSARAALLSAMRSGLAFIPLVLTLPRFLGLLGLELAQPCADVLAFLVCLPVTELFLKHLPRETVSN